MQSDRTVGGGITLIGAGAGAIMTLNPDWLPQWLADHPGIHLGLNIAFIVMIVGGLVLLFLSDFRSLTARFPHGVLLWHIGWTNGRLCFCFESWVPIRFLMPLQKAARIAYDETANSVVTGVLARLSEYDQEQILNSAAERLTKLVATFGSMPPGTQIKPIEKDMIKNGRIQNSATNLVINGGPTYTDLHIFRVHLRRAIGVMRKGEI